MSLRLLLLGVLAGLAAFAGAAGAWTALDWPGRDPRPLPDGDQFLETWGPRLPASGLYRFPAPPGREALGGVSAEEKEADLARLRKGPVLGLLVYHADGRDPTAPAPYLRELGLDVLCGLLLALLLHLARPGLRGLRARLLFSLLVGALISLAGPALAGNWWGLPWDYVAARALASLVAWSFAGAVLVLGERRLRAGATERGYA